MKKFDDELSGILANKAREVNTLIRKAINSGVHVDILVTAEVLVDMVWKHYEDLGFPKGSSNFTHVLPDLDDNAVDGHLRIHITNICAI